MVVSGRAYKYEIFYDEIQNGGAISKHSRSCTGALLRSAAKTGVPVTERPDVPERVNAARPGARAKNRGQRVRTRRDRGTWG